MSRNNRSISLFLILLLTFISPNFSSAQEHYHLLKKTVIGGEGGWDFISIDENRRHLFITHNTQVDVYDMTKDSVIADILNTEGAHGVAIASKEGHGFIS